MAKKRPMTQEEIRATKQKKKEYVTVLNISDQLVTLNCKPPAGVDFYIGEQAIRLYPKKHAKIDKSRVRMYQIENLQKKGLVRLVSDTSKKK